jgi:hypothetical protein
MRHTFRTMLLALLALAFIRPVFAQFAVTVAFGPPALPIYDQPICPGDGFLWTPGYWAYDPDDGYYWVPGTWVEAPEVGYLWTPAWWGWETGGFRFHEGYWGSEVGFYGGISYGFGYFGTGFEGGRWDHDHFFYNRAVLNIDVTNIHNVYNTTVIHETVINRVSYNGGQGGIDRRPTPQEQAVEQQRHIPPVAAQTQHVQAARSNPQMRAEANQGKPPVAATSRPGEFSGKDVVAAKAEGAPYHPAPSRSGASAAGGTASPSSNPTHARELQPHTVQPAPSSGNDSADKKYQQQQQKLVDKQNQEHQKLQTQQDKEDQQITKQNNQQRQQMVEQKHTQQTQELEQKHTQQQQQLQTRAPAPRPAPRSPR